MASDSMIEGEATGQKMTDLCERLIVDPSTLPSLLTAAEVASLLRLKSEKAVYAIAASGALPGVVRIGRRFRVRRDELLRRLEAHVIR